MPCFFRYYVFVIQKAKGPSDLIHLMFPAKNVTLKSGEKKAYFAFRTKRMCWKKPKKLSLTYVDQATFCNDGEQGVNVTFRGEV